MGTRAFLMNVVIEMMGRVLVVGRVGFQYTG